MKELHELIELAKQATRGKWRSSSTVFNGVTATPFTLEFGKEVLLASCPEKRDALFIAAANPEAILAIAESYRALEQENILLKQGCENNPVVHEMLDWKERAEAAEAKLAENEKSSVFWGRAAASETIRANIAEKKLAELENQESPNDNQ